MQPDEAGVFSVPCMIAIKARGMEAELRKEAPEYHVSIIKEATIQLTSVYRSEASLFLQKDKELMTAMASLLQKGSHFRAVICFPDLFVFSFLPAAHPLSNSPSPSTCLTKCLLSVRNGGVEKAASQIGRAWLQYRTEQMVRHDASEISVQSHFKKRITEQAAYGKYILCEAGWGIFSLDTCLCLSGM